MQEHPEQSEQSALGPEVADADPGRKGDRADVGRVRKAQVDARVLLQYLCDDPTEEASHTASSDVCGAKTAGDDLDSLRDR